MDGRWRMADGGLKVGSAVARLIYPPSAIRHRPGFSLIEIVVAVAIMALLATLAGVSLMGARSKATMGDVIERVIAYDAGARVYAARFEEAVDLRFGEHGVTQLAAGAEESDEGGRGPLLLDEAFTLRVVGVAEGGEPGDTRPGPSASPPGGTRLRTGVGEGEEGGVAISSQGRSRTYGVEVSGPGGEKAWAVVLGLTGEAVRFDDEEAFNAMLESLASPDAG